MKIVVTGALGHIGSRLIHAMRPGDYSEVVLVDNLVTQRFCSLFDLPRGVPFRFVEADVCTVTLEPLLAGADVVLHLAAITDAAGSFGKAEQVEHVNFEGTERVARACLASGCRMMFFSTTSVYGTQEQVVDERCAIEELKPQSPYAVSKLKSERLLEQLGRIDGLRYVACRFGTIFGTSIGMRFHTAVNKFCWQAATGQPLTVWRTAMNQKRPYLDLTDAVRAIGLIIRQDLFDGEVYNVLTLNATVSQIVTTISRHVGDVRVNYVDSPIMNQLSYEVSDQRFRSRGFTSMGSLEQGIRETIELLGQVRPGASVAGVPPDESR